MANQTPESQLLEIVEIVNQHPNGVTLKEILTALKTPIHLRTLQRRLSSLVAKGKIETKGNTKSKKYYPAQEDASMQNRPSKGSFLTLSKASQDLLKKVSLPKNLKQEVSYCLNFIQNYQPNSTFYLSEDLRQKLRALGNTQQDSFPAGTFAKSIFHNLLIDLSWNSSRLEGNTYSLLETEQLIDKGVFAKGKDSKETQMILNHKAAIEFLVDGGKKLTLDAHTVLNLHALLADNLLSDTACGSLRKIPVGVTHSSYTPPQIPIIIQECFEVIIQKASQIKDPFEQAFFLMIHIPYLRPFEDVNKRTSRLACNIPLIQHNLCPLSFSEVPYDIYINALFAVYELNQIHLMKDLFAWAYERSCFLYSKARNTIGEPDLFRLKHRTLIIETIRIIVVQKQGKLAAIEIIRQKAEEAKLGKETNRFIETVERELQALHQGSIARYQLTENEFNVWKKLWH